MKLRSRLHLILLIALLAAGPTALALYLIPLPLQPYRAQITEIKKPHIPNPNIVFHDFDHDGNSEMFALKYQIDLNQAAAKIYSADGGLVDQWTFGERWLNRAFAFGDYDGDGTDEAYIFTQKQDSVFLYAFKPNGKGFFINRRFIDKIAKRNQQGGWDVQAMPGAFIDSDDDGFTDFIFGLMAGLSLQPRRYYAFSPAKNKIIFKSPAAFANFIGPQIVDLDGDGQAELFNKGSNATDNAHEDTVAFKDNHAWLFLFDKQLRFKTTPLPFGAERSEIRIFPFTQTPPKELIVLHNYFGARDEQPALYLVNAQGRIVKMRKLPKGKTYCLFPVTRSGEQQMYLMDGEGQFEQIGQNLQTMQSGRTPFTSGTFLWQIDLDGDFSEELIFRNGPFLYITQNDFTAPLRIPLPEHAGNPLISIKCQIGKSAQMAIQQGEQFFLIRYGTNPWYVLRHILMIAVFLALFAFIYLNFYIVNYFRTYSRALNILVRNPNRGILLLDNRGVIRQVNRTLIRQLKLESVDIKGQHFNRVFTDLPEVGEFINRLQAGGRPRNEEILINQPALHFRGVFFGKPLDGVMGYPSGYYFETNDYAGPVQDDRLKVWSKTVQKMAHDIKTPLSSISLYLKTIDLKLEDHAPQARRLIKDDLETMISEMNRVREMTKNFLKFTNLEAPSFSSCSLPKLINQVLLRFKSYEKQGLQIALELDPEAEEITADKQQLSMALQAVLENAVDAVRGKGLIYITTTLNHRLDERFKPYVEIEIADNGPGIPEDIKQKIFEPYFTTKTDGTGMGLAIVHKILLDHQGKVEIVSRGNFATVVRITLPIGNMKNQKSSLM